MKKIELISLLWMLSFYGGIAQSPGGVSSNLQLWLKANAGTSSMTNGADVSSWMDQVSSSTMNIVDDGNAAEGVLYPTYQVNAGAGINFNPVVQWQNDPDQLLDFGGAVNVRTAFFVITDNTSGYNNAYFNYENVNSSGGYDNFHIGDGTYSWTGNPVPNSYKTASISINGTSIGVATTAPRKADGIPHIGRIALNGSNLNTFGWGRGNATGGLGGNIQSRNFRDKLGEIVVFNTALSTTDANKVESYLSLKYGITKAGNYVSSSNDVIWDATSNSAYHFNIAGIGQDDDSDLLQKQSRSVHSDAIVTIGLTTIEATNVTNTATFAANKTFMTWGNNNNFATTFTSTGAPSGYNKLAKTWKVTETQTIGNVMLTVDVNNSIYNLDAFDGNLYLIKGTDLSIATPVQMYDDGTHGDATSGDGIWTLNAVDFTTGDLFSFATVGCPNQVALAAVNGTVTASASCFKVNGWTYYFDNANPTNAVFAIEHKPAGGNTNNFEAQVSISVTATPTTAAGIYAVTDNSAQEGNFTLGRTWNVNVTSGTLNGNVNVRFYYDPAELAIIQSEANAYANASTPTLNVSAPIWFKTVGATYDPTTNTATTVNNGNIIEFGNLTPATEDGITYVEMTGVTSFSGGGVAYRVSPLSSPSLPVELKNFDAYSKDCNGMVKWTTASEENFSHFELERSEDGSIFRKIATIQAKGGKFAQSYSFDDVAANQRNYYRLRMVDLDGSFEISTVEFVKKECGPDHNKFDIYPNPIRTGEQLNVKFYTDKSSAKFTIMDLFGRPVHFVSLETVKGWNDLNFNISDLVPSNYTLKIEDGVHTETQQFIKLR